MQTKKKGNIFRARAPQMEPKIRCKFICEMGGVEHLKSSLEFF